MVKNYENIQVKQKPDAIAIIRGSNSYSDIHGTVYFYQANEGVMAFNFFKTVDEITESQALDTDLKTWANAQGWKLTDEDQSVDISVDYDFDPEEVTEGVYEITFSTTGREFKIHTTDYSEEGQEVGLTFFPEDIHVMPKVVF